MIYSIRYAISDLIKGSLVLLFLFSFKLLVLDLYLISSILSIFSRRYHELLDIISSASSPELIELLDSLAFRGFIHRNAY